MKMFQFAIASIVDANTGNGLVHGAARHDYGSLEKRGRRIRSRSVIDLARVIKNRIADFVERQRINAQQRRDLNRLLELNDHLLDDIGLQRSDLYQVQAGAVRLEELVAGYRSQRRREQTPVKVSAETEIPGAVPDAINEQFYEQRKCA